ncbi:MAG TPA: PQQ-dependent sugar dehydrogenase [Ignavibacteria bacterium]|nr:PQQ-dependent sugar dehydrogenase [Ignavibacteria bacterium]HMR41954.1 PQQ-dependent sugar dehydrogenase [Ignavibacteria bacterium]
MKKLKQLFTFLFLLVLFSNSYSQPYQLENAFPNASFSAPLYVTHSNDATNRVFVVEKGGRIKVLPNDSTTSNVKVFLDISNLIGTGSEKGLLGLAFHPDYANNGYFYIDYTRLSDGATTIARFNRSTSDPDKADSLSQLVLMTIPQPYTNHNGGIVFFGLDGYLYIGMGDGGSGGDPGNRAQTLTERLGKVLRINVDSTSGGNNYAIPPTNPFAKGGGAPEIFTIGMRNPWRISQDPVTGLIYCADVGQDAWEEVDILEVGKNYGWRCYEGNHTYNTSNCGPMADYTFPIKEYANAGSDISITGGFVYRGQRRPELTGNYIYADYGSRKMWRLKYENGAVTEDSLIMTGPSGIYSFGIDQNNELYVCGANNIVYRFNKSNLVGIGNGDNEVPDGYTLEQNYPNPFNPSTSINYYVPELSKVSLTVYDALGKEIATLVNTNQLPGNYSITWNGKDSRGYNLPSGAYLYRLNAGDNFSETKRMIMVK